MKKVPWKELATVAAVGAAACWASKKVPVFGSVPLVGPAMMLTAAYMIGVNRPESGYKLLGGG